MWRLLLWAAGAQVFFDPDLGGGVSIKPGNARVDMRRLLVAGSQTARYRNS
jgi:hypothetical protein